jgi:toxin YhaV
LQIHGWEIYAHSLFLDQLEELAVQVQHLKEKDPYNYKKKNASKRLAAILKLAYEVFPKDPTLPDYRQGNTLGKDKIHWFLAKFFQQYRLFFRYHLEKIIVIVWVNDGKTKRAYNSKKDAYRVFEKMLNNGNPPDSWIDLMKQSKIESERLQKIRSNDKPEIF